MCAGVGQYVIFFWIPSYYNSHFGVDVEQSATLSISPWVFTIIFTLGAGYMADKIVNKGLMKLIHVRKLFQSIAGIGGAVCFLGLSYNEHAVCLAAYTQSRLLNRAQLSCCIPSRCLICHIACFFWHCGSTFVMLKRLLCNIWWQSFPCGLGIPVFTVLNFRLIWRDNGGFIECTHYLKIIYFLLQGSHGALVSMFIVTITMSLSAFGVAGADCSPMVMSWCTYIVKNIGLLYMWFVLQSFCWISCASQEILIAIT